MTSLTQYNTKYIIGDSYLVVLSGQSETPTIDPEFFKLSGTNGS